MSLLSVVCEMAPYLLLGFFIAGVLHVFVPQKFYANYLSRSNKLSVVWAALLGIPLPLCSCGVIPTAIGLRNEKASKGAIASFLIATPQTGIDSILATFSLMGLGFAIIRPTAALITGICGGLLVNRFVKDPQPPSSNTQHPTPITHRWARAGISDSASSISSRSVSSSSTPRTCRRLGRPTCCSIWGSCSPFRLSSSDCIA